MSDATRPCKHCGHSQLDHMTVGRLVCLRPGLGRCDCPGYEDGTPPEKPLMFAVRIDRTAEGYLFKTEPMSWCMELVMLDSTPAIIAFVEAPNPGAAAARAWEKGLEMELHRQLPLVQEPAQLGDKKEDGRSA